MIVARVCAMTDNTRAQYTENDGDIEGLHI